MNVHEAKAHLSEMLARVEAGAQGQVVGPDGDHPVTLLAAGRRERGVGVDTGNDARGGRGRRDVLDGIKLKCERFEFCPEITAKVLLGGDRIHEVPLTFFARTFAEGKKIGWKDGVRAIYCIVRYNLFR